MLWNSEKLKLRRTKWGKNKHIRYCRRKRARNFPPGGPQKCENDTANIYRKDKGKKGRMWLEIAQGILRRRLVALAVSNL